MSSDLQIARARLVSVLDQRKHKEALDEMKQHAAKADVVSWLALIAVHAHACHSARTSEQSAVFFELFAVSFVAAQIFPPVPCRISIGNFARAFVALMLLMFAPSLALTLATEIESQKAVEAACAQCGGTP